MAYDLEIQVAQSQDDASERYNGVCSIVGTTLYIGGDYDDWWGFRFQNVAVPKGSTIDEAYIQIYVPSLDDPDINIDTEALDDGTVFTSDADNISNRTLVGSPVNWSADNIGTGWKLSPEIKTILQAIIDREGWASGQAINIIFHKTNGSLCTVRGWDYDDHSLAAKLLINFTAPGPSLPTVTTQAATNIDHESATGNGNITDNGGENCDKRGIVYGKVSQGDPGNVAPGASGYDDFEEETNSFGTGAFTRSLTNLDASTKYYARAYAHNSAGYSYGAEINFTTLAPPTTPNFTNRNNYSGYLAFIQQFIKHKINSTTPWQNPDGTLIP